MKLIAILAAVEVALGGVAVWQVHDSAAAAPTHCSYRAGGLLPDRRCTPGVVNRHVTQSTIRATICRPGWTRTIRPASSVTYPLKRAAMRAYGVGNLPASGFEYDHLIPLELGGAPLDPRNLWPEPIRAHDGAYAKDAVEDRLHRAVCAGKLTLRAARAAIRRDWRTAP